MSTLLLEPTTGTGSSATEQREVAVPTTVDLSTLLPPRTVMPKTSSVAPGDILIEALTVTVLAVGLLAAVVAELEDQEWDALFRTPSPQQQAFKDLLAEGRRQYAAGEAEQIIGDTFG
jgi:hypothetical protein